MDAVVTARVPVEVKEQATHVLRAIGATPTQLINAAYSYVLETGSLPCARVQSETVPGSSDAPIVKTLPDARRAALCSDLDAMTRAVPESFWRGLTYDRMIEEGRRADYEALA